MSADHARRLRRIEQALQETTYVSDLIPSWEDCVEAADRMHDSYWCQLRIERKRGKIEAGSIDSLTFELIDREVGTESWRQANRSLFRRASTSTIGSVHDGLDVRSARFAWCWLAEHFERSRALPPIVKTGQNRTEPDRTSSVPN